MLVPTELVEHIFSFLWGEISALKACSKAHPIFSSVAEPYLYADIVINIRSWNDKDQKALSELCNQLSDNPHLLDFPRTLSFHRIAKHPYYSPEPKALSIILMIPRMVNLVSLTWTSHGLCEGFVSMFRTCLQQSTIENLCLEYFCAFPLSILDSSKTIKKLVLIGCTAMSENELLLTSGPPHQPLETLIMGSRLEPNLLFWASHRATGLKTLEFRDSLETQSRKFAELLRICSRTLTRLHFDIGECRQNKYLVERGLPGHWVDDNHRTFPFTLSAHKRLREVSISAQIASDSNKRIYCALPAILQLIKTAPSIPDVVLSFQRVSFSMSLRRDAPRNQPLDLSPLLDRLWSDFPAGGIRPRIDLNIRDVYSGCLEPLTIHDVLATTRIKDENSN